MVRAQPGGMLAALVDALDVVVEGAEEELWVCWWVRPVLEKSPVEYAAPTPATRKTRMTPRTMMELRDLGGLGGACRELAYCPALNSSPSTPGRRAACRY